jgi:hypothetical protein
MTHQPSTPTLPVNQELVERKRVINYEREAKRWDRVRMEEKFEDIKLQELKESQIPELNKSSVKYNMITLQYEDSHDGQSLKYRDDLVKRHMAVQANKGLRHMKSSVNYDMITGEPVRVRRAFGVSQIRRQVWWPSLCALLVMYYAVASTP